MTSARSMRVVLLLATVGILFVTSARPPRRSRWAHCSETSPMKAVPASQARRSPRPKRARTSVAPPSRIAPATTRSTTSRPACIASTESSSGSKSSTREGVEVSVNTTVRVEIVLAVGQLEESVIVTGEAPMLQTDRTDTGRIIESTQITQMPLGFNRNFQALLITVPGASRPFRPHSEFYNSQESLSSNVNGQSRQVNNVQLEGADNSDNGGSLAFYIPSAEAIETVSVATSNYDAEFGRAGGAVTNVTIKSGTNAFSGSVFAFGNTEATVSRNPFTTLTPADCQVHAGGLYVWRADQARQAVLLRRFRPHQRRQRTPQQGHVPERRIPHRRFQWRADAAFTIRRLATPTAAAARSFRTIRFRPIGSARSHGV